jgi:hypothetical protein
MLTQMREVMLNSTIQKPRNAPTFICIAMISQNWHFAAIPSTKLHI